MWLPGRVQTEIGGGPEADTTLILYIIEHGLLICFVDLSICLFICIVLVLCIDLWFGVIHAF